MKNLVPHSGPGTSRATVLVLLAFAAFITSTGCGSGSQGEGTGSGADTIAGANGTAATTQPGQRVYTPEEQAIIERMRNASTDEIKAYLHEVLQLQLPPDYVVPDYIRDAGTPEQALDTVNARYPNFEGKRGAELLQAIAADPIAHRDLILENRAVRMFYADTIKKRMGQ